MITITDVQRNDGLCQFHEPEYDADYNRIKDDHLSKVTYSYYDAMSMSFTICDKCARKLADKLLSWTTDEVST